jgi:hypothetical protein
MLSQTDVPRHQEGWVGGEQTVYNYAATFFSAAALVAYDAPMHNWLVMGINLVVLFMEAFYIVIFFFHAEGRTRRITIWMIVSEIVWIILLGIIYFSFFYGDRHEGASVMVFGILGSISAFFMYGLLLVDTVCDSCVHCSVPRKNRYNQ